MKLLFSIILIFISLTSLSQKTNSYLNDSTKMTFEKYDLLQEKADLEFKLLNSENELLRQKTYKMLFLAISGFIILISAFVVVLFYHKSKKITEIIKIQNREIVVRDNKNQHLSLVLNTVKTPILIASSSGKIKWVNKAFSEFYKMDYEFLNENNIQNFLKDIASDKEKQLIFDSFEKKENVSYKIKNNENDFNSINREITLIIDSENEISGFAVTDNLQKS